ncbi:hypothetical protein SAY87_005203 [Trapa incisa]|uniref:Uncharacterized protein n=1 Tax=Trapa incisa TaxID=236973 RepID=A0AAN7QBB9_9MYRT|nr:hypothetical protein SAY87_005203 [Trapa incisa]
MGMMLSKLFSRFFVKKKLRILMAVLDAAGKTMILQAQCRRNPCHHPYHCHAFTVFNVETKYKSISLLVWGVGDQDKRAKDEIDEEKRAKDKNFKQFAFFLELWYYYIFSGFVCQIVIMLNLLPFCRQIRPLWRMNCRMQYFLLCQQTGSSHFNDHSRNSESFGFHLFLLHHWYHPKHLFNLQKRPVKGFGIGSPTTSQAWHLSLSSTVKEALLREGISSESDGQQEAAMYVYQQLNRVSRAGLKRTGKSCRLRWLNYLQPNVRRGNITLEEQLLIMELQAKLGNRWSKIAKHLPGRTDNEIKNFWRTRIQKHMKQLPENSSDRPPLHRHAFVMPDILQPSSPPANLWLDGINCDHRLGNTIPMPDTYTSPAAFPAAPDAFQEPPPMESNISYWSMEGLLSEKLLNGD